MSIKALITLCDIQICVHAATDQRAVYTYETSFQRLLYHYFCYKHSNNHRSTGIDYSLHINTAEVMKLRVKNHLFNFINSLNILFYKYTAAIFTLVTCYFV